MRGEGESRMGEVIDLEDIRRWHLWQRARERGGRRMIRLNWWHAVLVLLFFVLFGCIAVLSGYG